MIGRMPPGRTRALPLRVLMLVAVCVAIAMSLTSCATREYIPGPCPYYVGDTHNACGAYVDACGNLPGLVGDDC